MASKGSARLGKWLIAVGMVTSAIAIEPPFNAAEQGLIRQLGPWPVPWTRDTTNPVSGNPAAIALGERLFFDKRLSAGGQRSCATCHDPERGWSDGRTTGVGIARLKRNVPGLANVQLQRTFGWTGDTDRLWLQSAKPIVDPRELGASPAEIAQVFAADPMLSESLTRLFVVSIPDRKDALLERIGMTIAAFLETLPSPRIDFDRFRNALASGDAEAVARYPIDAKRGLRLFIGRARCIECHGGPAFTDGAKHVVVAGSNAIRTPGLRNAAITPPYLHDGSVPTLHDVARRHRASDGPELTAVEVHDLVAFLSSLTDRAERWWPTPVAKSRLATR